MFLPINGRTFYLAVWVINHEIMRWDWHCRRSSSSVRYLWCMTQLMRAMSRLWTSFRYRPTLIITRADFALRQAECCVFNSFFRLKARSNHSYSMRLGLSRGAWYDLPNTLIAFTSCPQAFTALFLLLFEIPQSHIIPLPSSKPMLLCIEFLILKRTRSLD